MSLKPSGIGAEITAEKRASYLIGHRACRNYTKENIMAKATKVKTAEVIVAAPIIKVLKTAACPSLSGKSDLGYEIGVDSQSGIHIQVTSNSGNGYFKPEWIALSAIQEKFASTPVITSFQLNVLFKGRSLNNSGFLFAVLKQEGIVNSSIDNPRKYRLGDVDAFIARVNSEVKPEKEKKAA